MALPASIVHPVPLVYARILVAKVIPVNESSSSAQKGETLSDTIRCLECYADVLVLRHPVKGSAAEAAKAASKPVINAVRCQRFARACPLRPALERALNARRR
jgi:aspartate carbamoyltransferase catalytic subunit